jgi:hypothetical protein
MANIVDPQHDVVKIGKARYRKLIVNEVLPPKAVQGYNPDLDEDDAADELNLEKERDNWVFHMEAPRYMHKFIIGRGGQTKQQLERDNRVQIFLPNREERLSEEEKDRVTIKSREKSSIVSAKAQLELLLEEQEERLPFTHFLSLPLATPELMDRVDEFQDHSVQAGAVDESMFMPSKRLHFTVCMLKLHSDELVNVCKRALQKFDYRAALPTPLTARLRGLHIMNDDKAAVDVVFTTDTALDLKERMNRFADALFKSLRAEGVLTARNLHHQRLLTTNGEAADVKLHCTLVNTKYRGGGGGARESFDASALLEEWGAYEFGEVPLNEMHLSVLGKAEGYYHSEAKISLV